MLSSTHARVSVCKSYCSLAKLHTSAAYNSGIGCVFVEAANILSVFRIMFAIYSLSKQKENDFLATIGGGTVGAHEPRPPHYFFSFFM